MKHSFTPLLLLACCISDVSATQMPEVDYAATMLETITYVDQHQNDVWPGFHLSSTPIVTHFDTRQSQDIHIYAFGFHPKNPAWQTFTVHGKPVSYLNKDLYHIRTIAWGFKKIDGQTSFIFDPKTDKDALHNTIDTVYFRFYNYQHYTDQSKFQKSNPDLAPVYNGRRQLLQSKLSFLELEALKTHLASKEVTEKENALKDAVAINQYRLTLLDKESQSFESFASHHHLSGYVAWKSVNLSQDNHYLQALNKVCTLTPKTTSQEIISCLDYYRYNFSTLVYGLALDKKTGFSWKIDAEANGTTTIDGLRKYYGFSNEEAEARVNSIVRHEQYNYKQIEKILDTTFSPYLDEITKQENNYKALPGVELKLVIFPSWEEQSSQRDLAGITNKKMKIYDINNKIALIANYTGKEGIYGREGWNFSAQFRNVPYIYYMKYFLDNEDRVDTFKISPTTKLVIDGVSDTVEHYMQAKKHLTFTKLQLENSKVKISLNKVRGDLDGTGESLALNWKLN